MDTIKLSIDSQAFSSKPSDQDVPNISTRIAKSPTTLKLSEISKFINSVATEGHTFCPATFKDGKRSKETFKQQQIFALDFDNKDPKQTISFEEVKARANYYDLPILFAYDTFSSTEHDKFRVIFLNDTSICHRKVAEAMQLALGEIFPEADSSCYKDISKIYFGGKREIYRGVSTSTINVDAVFRGLTYRLKDTKGNHYKEWIFKFSEETGIGLNKNGLLDVMVSGDPTEYFGVSQVDQNGKFSPNAIIYSPNIIPNGENLRSKYYCLRFTDCTSKSSVVTSGDRTDVTNKEYKNHNPYRKSDVDRMGSVCRLFREFETGSRDMTHDELFGILNNLLCADSGITRFREIQVKYPYLYGSDRRCKWERCISYNRSQGYKPSSCNSFCPYCKECGHAKNILTTVHPDRSLMEPDPNYDVNYCSLEEAQDNVYEAIHNAYMHNDNRIYIIKAQVGIGKSHSYLRIMKENSEKRFLIAAPTNMLKNELYDKAKRMGINVRKTPSLDEIENEIPQRVWKHIKRFRKSGRHYLVHPYINKSLQKRNIPCLKEYMKEREDLMDFCGSIITTHRYLLNMNKKRLREYDSIIIDEDIIFKSIIPNQEEISISDLKKFSKEVANQQVKRKLKELIAIAKEQSCIELDSFEYEYDDEDADDVSIKFDIPSFCMANIFYVRRSATEPNLKEDTVVFLKPATFKDVKYVMVSATASEDVCRKYFGEDRVDFVSVK